MLRIRDKAGNVTVLSDTQFIEICDTEGAVAKVMYQDGQGLIRGITAADLESQQYSKLFHVKFVPLVPLKDT